MPARFDFLPPGAQDEVDFRIGGEELGAEADQSSLGRGDLEVIEQHAGEQLVDQDAAVLGIVAKLDDVPVAVIRLQQMGLGASSHFADVPDGG